MRTATTYITRHPARQPSALIVSPARERFVWDRATKGDGGDGTILSESREIVAACLRKGSG
jgi:hypothetical protein